MLSELAVQMEKSNVLMECHDLRKNYVVRGKKITVLKGVNLSIARGKICIINGRSGAGKSTLLSLLGGLERPTTGSITFKNQRLEKMDNEALAKIRRDSIGILRQSYNLIPSWTASENVEAALMHIGMTKSDRNTKTRTLLTAMGLADRLDNLPAELSGGQQQRVAVARTMANEPEFILADEPTGELDTQTANDIIKILVDLVKEKNIALVVVTKGDFLIHMAQVMLKSGNNSLEYIETIYHLRKGQLINGGGLAENRERIMRGDF